MEREYIKSVVYAFIFTFIAAVLFSVDIAQAKLTVEQSKGVESAAIDALKSEGSVEKAAIAAFNAAVNAGASKAEAATIAAKVATKAAVAAGIKPADAARKAAAGATEAAISAGLKASDATSAAASGATAGAVESGMKLADAASASSMGSKEGALLAGLSEADAALASQTALSAALSYVPEPAEGYSEEQAGDTPGPAEGFTEDAGPVTGFENAPFDIEPPITDFVPASPI